MNREQTQLDLTRLKPTVRFRSYLNSIRMRERGVAAGAIEVSVPARIALGLAILAYVVYIGRHSLLTQWAFGTGGFDIGIFDQGVWLLSRFKDPFITIMGVDLFGDHTSFILLPLVPLYWIHPSASILLVAQTLALAGAAIPVFLIGRDRFRHEVLALGAAVAYLLHPAVALTNLENFHPDPFEVPLVLFALFFMLQRRWVPYFVFVVATLLVKEDVPLLIFGLGAYVAIRLDRKIGLATMAMAVAWFLLNILVILPGFNELGTLDAWRIPTAQFEDSGGLIKAVFTRPWEVAAIAFERERLWYLFQLLAPFAFLSLGGPGLTLAASGPLLSNLLSTFWYQYNIGYHYTTLIVPVFVTAAIVGIAGFRDERVRRLLVGAMVLAAIASAWAWGPFGKLVSPDPNAEHPRAIRAALEKVPDDSVVSAFYAYVPHLAHREEIYEFPVPWEARNWGAFEEEGEELDFTDRIEFVVVPPEGLSVGDRTILKDIAGDFSVVHDQDGILVLSRVKP